MPPRSQTRNARSASSGLATRTTRRPTPTPLTQKKTDLDNSEKAYLKAVDVDDKSKDAADAYGGLVTTPGQRREAVRRCRQDE